MMQTNIFTKFFTRRALLLLVIASLMLSGLTLAGCHGKKESAAFAVPDAFDDARTYEITFWAKNDTNKTQTAIYEKAIADFEALYPNIKVTMRLYTDYGKIYNDVITNIATDTTPNVCITYPDHIATYMTGDNTVVCLDDLFSDKKYGLGGSEVRYDSVTQAEVVPEFLNECRIGDHYYAIPYMRSTEACYVNRDYVEALGFELPETLTWNFIWEVCEAAMEKNADGTYKINGQNVMIPFIYKSTDNMMIQMLRQLEAGYSTDEGAIEIFNDTTRGILKEIAVHAKSGEFSTFKISSYPANFLNAGQCIFAVDSTAGATWMGSKAPLIDIPKDQLVDFETVVMTIPQYDTGNPAMISQGPSVCVFNKEDPQEVLASWLFAQYLLTNDVQIAYSETEGYVPVTLKAQQDADYVDYISRSGEDNSTHYSVKIDAAKLLVANTENTFVTPVFNGSASLRNAAGQMIEESAKGARRKKDVNDAFIDDLYEEMTSLYKLDQVEAASGSTDLGPLPGTAKALLFSIAGAWVLIILVFGTTQIRKRRQGK